MMSFCYMLLHICHQGLWPFCHPKFSCMLLQLIPFLILGTSLLSYSFGFSRISPNGIIHCVTFVFESFNCIVQCDIWALAMIYVICSFSFLNILPHSIDGHLGCLNILLLWAVLPWPHLCVFGEHMCAFLLVTYIEMELLGAVLIVLVQLLPWAN
jgi:hypothetical protein